jgi:hypothetical protein
MCLHCGRLFESYLRNRGRQHFCRADARSLLYRQRLRRLDQDVHRLRIPLALIES